MRTFQLIIEKTYLYITILDSGSLSIFPGDDETGNPTSIEFGDGTRIEFETNQVFLQEIKK